MYHIAVQQQPTATANRSRSRSRSRDANSKDKGAQSTRKRGKKTKSMKHKSPEEELADLSTAAESATKAAIEGAHCDCGLLLPF